MMMAAPLMYSWRYLFARHWRLSSREGHGYRCVSVSTVRDGRKRATVNGHLSAACSLNKCADSRSSKSGLRWSILHTSSFPVRLAMLWPNFNKFKCIFPYLTIILLQDVGISCSDFHTTCTTTTTTNGHVDGNVR